MMASNPAGHPVERQLLTQISRHWPGGESTGKLNVALSGGGDSTALLVATTRIFGSASVRALHANHKLHSRSDDWAAHCQDLCASLQVESVVAELKLGTGNVEGAAREARYDFFRCHLQADDLLLLGHHGQDQLETVLMRLIQGRSSLPMRAQGRLGEGHFLRPFLAMEQQQLAEYLKELDVAWLEDPSNQDQQLTRNFLRHSVIRPLRSRWPKAHVAVQRVVDRQQAQYALLQELLADVEDQVPTHTLPTSVENRRAWLRVYVELRGHFAVTDKALDEFCRQLDRVQMSRLVLGSDSALLVWRGHLYYEPAMERYADDTGVEPTTLDQGKHVFFAGQHWSLVRADSDATDAFYCPHPVHISGKRRGLVMQWRGRKVSIEDLLRDLRIPPWRRAATPLLVHGSEVVAVADLAVSEGYRNPAPGQELWRLVKAQ